MQHPGLELENVRTKRAPRTGSTQSTRFTRVIGAPVAENTNIMIAGPRGPALLQDIWLIEKIAK
jgi:catalase